MNTKPMTVSLSFYAHAAITLLTDHTEDGFKIGSQMVREVCAALEAVQKGESFKGEYLSIGETSQ